MRSYFYTIVATFVVLTLLTFGIRFVGNPWPLSFLYSFQLHFSILLVFLSLFCLMLKRGYLSVFLLLLTMSFVAYTLYLHFKHVSLPIELSEKHQVLRVMSFNILEKNSQSNAVVDVVLNSDADVAIILESAPLESKLERLQTIYPYRVGCGLKTELCDLMILSKYPIESSRINTLANLRQQRFMHAEINYKGQEINIVAAHASKPYYDTVQYIELFDLTHQLRKIDGPLVLAGDFNSAIYSPDMQRLLKVNKLKLSWWEPATWPISLDIFGLPIDHIFVREPYVIKSLDRLPESYGSNHFGLMADIYIPNN